MAKILVIDDAPEVRELILTMLKLRGHEAIGAKDGVTGLQVAREQVPDLIICDIIMPNMDGYQLLEALRAEPETMIVPFIFLTAKSDKMDRRRGMLLGADDYITKPFQLDDLLQAVEVRLTKHAAVSKVYQKELEDLRLRLAGTLPHELRTPLSGILTTSKVILELRETLSRDKTFEMIGVMHGAAERLYHLVENYVLFSELALISEESEILKALQKQRTDEAQEVIARIAVAAADKVGRDSDVILEFSKSSVNMSDVYLTKIAAELIDNALKFSVPGTPVVVKAQSVDSQFVLSITDRGRGMTPQQIAHIDAYVQFSRDQYEQQGSGLGLVIVRQLACLHGGHLDIESTPGVQTTVRVTLPANS